MHTDVIYFFLKRYRCYGLHLHDHIIFSPLYHTTECWTPQMEPEDHYHGITYTSYKKIKYNNKALYNQ